MKMVSFCVSTRWLGVASVLALAATSFAQQKLTLADAIQMARKNNGTIQAAFYDVESSRSRLAASFGAFLPSITPSYTYENSRTRSGIGGSNEFTSTSNEGTGSLRASWLLLDSGQRDLNYRASKRVVAQQGSNALQTLRETLFTVHEQYFNALRSQELVRVNEASVERAAEILKATEVQIELKVAPPKDRLQANADLLNAKVGLLSARNRFSTSGASLKATIGLDGLEPLPDLDAISAPGDFSELDNFDAVLKQGLAQREDLKARRFSIEAQRLSAEIAERESGITWTLDASFNRTWSGSENGAEQRNLTFLASIPLFDGNRKREAARQERLNVLSSEASYQQSVRLATAEIESAYLTLKQDRERYFAAKAALDAAKENYAAALESQRLGAEGTSIITVLTAKISLVTAESNYVEAVYDVYISDVRLRLATGQPLPGESP